MAIAPVLKTGVRKDLGVRIPCPPLSLGVRVRRRLGEARVPPGPLTSPPPGTNILPVRQSS